MVAKCANPACSATFRYLHEGELFAIESKPDPLQGRAPADPEYRGSSPPYEYFWLCSSCCCVMRVQSDGNRRIVLVPKRKSSTTFSATSQDSSLAI